MWGSVLAITWTRAVITCRVNCCRRPVSKKSGFDITINRRRLAALQTPPPANSIFTTSTLATCRRRFADVPAGSDVADFRCPMCTSAELYRLPTGSLLVPFKSFAVVGDLDIAHLRKYAVRVEHCFCVLPDQEVDWFPQPLLSQFLNNTHLRKSVTHSTG